MTLIQKAKSDPQAFVKLYDLYVEKVYGYLLRRVQNSTEAEDLCSQVWEKALAKIHTLKSDTQEGFAAWLFAVARNELNAYFNFKKIKGFEELKDVFSDLQKKPDEQVEQDLTADLIQKTLVVLPEQQRETVELRYFADLRNKEIALILEVSEKTVASNLSRALKTLQQYLEKLQ